MDIRTLYDILEERLHCWITSDRHCVSVSVGYGGVVIARICREGAVLNICSILHTYAQKTVTNSKIDINDPSSLEQIETAIIESKKEIDKVMCEIHNRIFNKTAITAFDKNDPTVLDTFSKLC